MLVTLLNIATDICTRGAGQRTNGVAESGHVVGGIGGVGGAVVDGLVYMPARCRCLRGAGRKRRRASHYARWREGVPSVCHCLSWKDIRP